MQRYPNSNSRVVDSTKSKSSTFASMNRRRRPQRGRPTSESHLKEYQLSLGPVHKQRFWFNWNGGRAKRWVMIDYKQALIPWWESPNSESFTPAQTRQTPQFVPWSSGWFILTPSICPQPTTDRCSGQSDTLLLHFTANSPFTRGYSRVLFLERVCSFVAPLSRSNDYVQSWKKRFLSYACTHKCSRVCLKLRVYMPLGEGVSFTEYVRLVWTLYLLARQVELAWAVQVSVVVSLLCWVLSPFVCWVFFRVQTPKLSLR